MASSAQGGIRPIFDGGVPLVNAKTDSTIPTPTHPLFYRLPCSASRCCNLQVVIALFRKYIQCQLPQLSISVWLPQSLEIRCLDPRCRDGDKIDDPILRIFRQKCTQAL